MMILAVRDNETGKPVEVREVGTPDEMEAGALYTRTRSRYQPPRFEIVLGMAKDKEAFLVNYPRFRGAEAGKKEGAE